MGQFLLAEIFSVVGLWGLFARLGDPSDISVFLSLGYSELMLAVYESLDVQCLYQMGTRSSCYKMRKCSIYTFRCYLSIYELS